MIRIDLQSATPVAEQIVREIRRVIARGDLRPGDPLPPVRQLAGDLDIHWNTVARSYRELAAMGFLTVVRGRRAVVRPETAWRTRQRHVTERVVMSRLRSVLTEASLAGLSRKEVYDMFERAMSSWFAVREPAVAPHMDPVTGQVMEDACHEPVD